MMEVMLVAIGGAGEALIRFALTHLLPLWRGFPLAILAANVVGSFALGVIIVVASQSQFLLLGVGLCGGLTTVSTWAIDTLTLGRSGASGVATVNVVVSVAASVGACAVGMLLAGGMGS
ncbi:MAG: CrcB family protein [Candidatus Nanopelagicales bacterium]